jgi:hypothetical protein
MHCLFTFALNDVPTSATQYQVEVAHRGKVIDSQADLKANGWVFVLTLCSS